MNEQVIQAVCFDCDWTYYARSEVSANKWAGAHAIKESHAIAVQVPDI